MLCDLQAFSVAMRNTVSHRVLRASRAIEHTTRSALISGDFGLVITLSSSHFDFVAPRLGLRLALVLADIVKPGSLRAPVDCAALAELPLQSLNHSFCQLNLKQRDKAWGSSVSGLAWFAAAA